VLPTLCPVLVGREDLLALADRRLGAAHDGSGELLILAGEAGIGKTRLLAAFRDRAAAAGFTTVGVGAYVRDTDVSGGVLSDLAVELERHQIAAGTKIADRLRGGEHNTEDPHRQRRMLVTDLAEAIAGIEGPALIALEDLHWADDLTLDVLERLARRLPSLPILVVATYRSDELYPKAPARTWRTRLLTQRLAEEVRLTRLAADQTAAMAAAIFQGVLPEAVIHDVFVRSDGIPLHVEEFLAIATDPGATDRVLPDTLADAVLTRAQVLSPAARALASAASVIGRSFDVDLLTAITDGTPDDIDAALRELDDRFFVQPRGDRPSYDFRHALIRDALYADLPPYRRRDLHARVAARAAAAGQRDAFVSDHYERAGRPAEAYWHALAAAVEAVGLSSHREAVELYRRAQRTAPTAVPAEDRAALLVALAGELAAIDDNAAAATTYEQAYDRLLQLGDRAGAAALMPARVAVQHLLGDDLARRTGQLQEALTLIDDAAPESRDIRTRILAALSAAYMLDRRLDESIEYGEQARAAGGGDRVTGINTDATLGSVLVFAGRFDEGWPMLEQAIREARAAQLEAEAARAYRMLGSSASVLVEYDRALHFLVDGIAYAERTERFNDRHYMAAHHAHALWAIGDWAESAAVAHRALADGGGGVTTRISALHVLGFLALGRGDWPAANRQLHEARTLGEQMHELQRLSPALWGLAEVALHSGQHREAIDWCTKGYEASAAVRDAAYLFPFVVTGTRAYLTGGDLTGARRWVDQCTELLRLRNIPGTLPALDHANGLVHLAGGHTAKARDAFEKAGWDARRRFWEGTQALLDRARATDRSRDRADLLAEAGRRAEAAGATTLLAGVPAVTAATDQPLTARELEVARLVATGATNREIATALYISPKTVAAHIEHILTKLGVGRRTEIAVWAKDHARAG
jgi:DNA-binding CsgD family transcriptional regulator/tetratricopeptide (TPR) repeat protein